MPNTKKKNSKKKNKKTSSQIDPKTIGVPNICFSLTEPDDDREKAYCVQRMKYGFDDSETWSLSDTIANFIIPRLERFIEIDKEVTKQNPALSKRRRQFLKAMKLCARDRGSLNFTEKELEQVQRGLEAFPDIFMSLWW